MPVPKRKKSASRSRAQRAANMRYSPSRLVPCGNCDELRQPHHVCESCGAYDAQRTIAAMGSS